MAPIGACQKVLQICTWCHAQNFTFVGHLYTDCDKLAKQREEQQRSKGKKQAATNHADDDVVELPSDNEDVAFHADVLA